METNISPATQKFIEACDKFSVDMLREAIAEGADLNYRDKYGDSPFDNMVWLADNAYDNTYDPEYNVGITGDDLIEFASVLIDNGFDLTYTPPEDKDEQGTFWSVVGEICSDSFAWEVLFCCGVEAFGDTVRGCLAFAGVARPSGSIEPLGAVSGGVDVDADEDDVGCAEGVAVSVYAADTFG